MQLANKEMGQLHHTILCLQIYDHYYESPQSRCPIDTLLCFPGYYLLMDHLFASMDIDY